MTPARSQSPRWVKLGTAGFSHTRYPNAGGVETFDQGNADTLLCHRVADNMVLDAALRWDEHADNLCLCRR